MILPYSKTFVATNFGCNASTYRHRDNINYIHVLLVDPAGNKKDSLKYLCTNEEICVQYKML